MKKSLHLLLDIEPYGAARARSTVGGRHYTPPKYRLWLDGAVKTIKSNVAGHIVEGSLSVDIIATLTIPKSRLKGKSALASGDWHTQKPDSDNIAKAILDAITKAGVWVDDCQIADLRIRKVWDSKGSITVCIKEL
jgi:Holliday junction resolvase RusA-like endonuclease